LLPLGSAVAQAPPAEEGASDREPSPGAEGTRAEGDDGATAPDRTAPEGADRAAQGDAADTAADRSAEEAGADDASQDGARSSDARDDGAQRPADQDPAADLGAEDEPEDDPLPEGHEPALTYEVDLGEDGARTGDLVRVVITAEVPEGDDVAVPEQTFGPFEIFDRRYSSEPVDGGRRR